MITIMTTGGTFDKVYFDTNSEFTVGEPQAKSLLEDARVTLEYRIESLLRKDSLDITDQDRHFICDRIKACNSQRILITHGTDGMVATAQAIATETKVKANKTVLLLGAMQPALMRCSDAAFNLGFGMAAVQLLSAGVYIGMNGRIFDHDKVAKNLQAGLFESKD